MQKIGVIFASQALWNALLRKPFWQLEQGRRQEHPGVPRPAGLSGGTVGSGLFRRPAPFPLRSTTMGLGVGVAFTATGAIVYEVVPVETQGRHGEAATPASDLIVHDGRFAVRGNAAPGGVIQHGPFVRRILHRHRGVLFLFCVQEPLQAKGLCRTPGRMGQQASLVRTAARWKPAGKAKQESPAAFSG
ncbi:MAG: hypothetical protein ABFD62_17815 [Syntrophaceae bacterium]